jgi:acetyl-CoA C-acetyltransferase
MEEVVLVSGARTPIGTFGGSLKDVAAAELGKTAIRCALERAGVDPAQVDDVIMGCVGQVGEDAYIARTSAVGAGIPIEVPAITVNRLCGSGLEAINRASQAIRAGDAEIIIAGGVENMSRFPYIVRNARWGIKMGDVPFEDALITGLNDPFNKIHMGVTAENLAKKYGISRQEQDEFAQRSQQRAVEAIQAGRFQDEIVPVTVPQRRGEPKVVKTDEHPRPDTTVDALGKLPAASRKRGRSPPATPPASTTPPRRWW